VARFLTIFNNDQFVFVGLRAGVLGYTLKDVLGKEIAERLFLAEGTIKNYVSNILSKLNTRDRTQAILKAQAMGFV
jgi:DNA-binding NarL/FixJ family response regulator